MSFNPDQPRDPDGKFGSGGGGRGSDESKLDRAYQRSMLSETQRDALYEYTEHGYADINGLLRSDDYYEKTYGDKATPQVKAEFDQQTQALDEIIDKQATPVDVVAYRGIGKDDPLGRASAEDLQKMVGTEFEDKGFVSTSLSQKTAAEFSFGTVFEIFVPKGTNAAWIPGYRPRAGEEKELLLGRDHRFRIEGVRANAFSYGGSPMDVVKVRMIS